MTKKQTAPEAVEETAKTDDDRSYERERDEQYLRRTALDFATTFHKTNGGMQTTAQLVNQAQDFLAFLKGENK